jgi:hypothetical protein
MRHLVRLDCYFGPTKSLTNLPLRPAHSTSAYRSGHSSALHSELIMDTIRLITLIILLIAALPTWPYSATERGSASPFN